jgi:hypothetical protein
LYSFRLLDQGEITTEDWNEAGVWRNESHATRSLVISAIA